jgi:hypothetical protein
VLQARLRDAAAAAARQAATAAETVRELQADIQVPLLNLCLQHFHPIVLHDSLLAL